MTVSTTETALPTKTKSMQDDLVELIYDGLFDDVHRDFRDALEDPLFDYREGLTMNEAARLSYERFQFMRERFESAAEIVDNPQRLFAIGEWPCLLDTTTLPLITVSYNLCLGSIIQHGRGRTDLTDYIEELTSSTVGMYMVTELGYGNNAASLQTEAVYDHENQEFILNTPNPAAQKFMPFTGVANIPKLAVVMARLVVESKDCGVFPFIVRITDEHGPLPGVNIAPLPEKPGMALDNGATWFDHVRIPRRNLLSGEMGELAADGHFRPSRLGRRARFHSSIDRVHAGRVCLAGALVAAGRASVYIATRYAQQRLVAAPGHGEQPIIAYRGNQLALFTALARVYAMTFLLNHVKRRFVTRNADNAGDVNCLLDVAKAVSSWQMSEVIHECRERCGAQGMFSVNRIADYVALAQGVVTAEGDNLPLLATAAAKMLMKSPAERPRPDSSRGDLLDPRFHLDLFRYYEHSLQQDTRSAIAHETCNEGTFASAWNHNMNAAVKMARIHGVRIALEQFITAAESAETGTVRDALRTLATLYGLTEIHRDAGWYLARRVMRPEQVELLPAFPMSACSLTDST